MKGHYTAVRLLRSWLPGMDATEREVLEVLRRRGGSVALGELLQICKTSSSTLLALEKLGQIDIFSSGEIRLKEVS